MKTAFFIAVLASFLLDGSASRLPDLKRTPAQREVCLAIQKIYGTSHPSSSKGIAQVSSLIDDNDSSVKPIQPLAAFFVADVL
jgi:hypothetical protein